MISSITEVPKKWNKIRKIAAVRSLFRRDPSSLWNDRLLILAIAYYHSVN